MKLTLAITVYNRYELLLESFANVIDDGRIDEILIMDDASDEEYWKKIKDLPKFNPKIKVCRQLHNRGMSVNKRDAVFNSKNEWVILFDSDNVIRKDYVDAFWRSNTDPFNIKCPDFAYPNFDYRKYSDVFFYAGEASAAINDSIFNCLLNTANYVVNREIYLKVWQENKEMKGTDTIWFNYLWLKSGHSFKVVKGMKYEHRVHDGSG